MPEGDEVGVAIFNIVPYDKTVFGTFQLLFTFAGSSHFKYVISYAEVGDF